MTRPKRQHRSGGIYYVVLFGNGGQEIFQDDADKKNFIELLSVARSRCNAEIFAFCLTRRDARLVVRVSDVPVGRLVQRVATQYSRNTHAKYATAGYLFKHPYRAYLLEGTTHLLEIVRHVHLAPLELDLTADLDGYRWCSHRACLGLELLEWLNSAPVMQLLGTGSAGTEGWAPANGPGTAAPVAAGAAPGGGGASAATEAIYRQFMTGPEEGAGGDDRPPRNQLPSDDHFFSWLRRHTGKPPATVTVDQVIQAVAKKMGVDRKRLLSTSRERRLTLTRALIGWHVTQNQIATLTEVSRQLGRAIHRVSIRPTRATGRGGRSCSGTWPRPRSIEAEVSSAKSTSVGTPRLPAWCQLTGALDRVPAVRTRKEIAGTKSPLSDLRKKGLHVWGEQGKLRYRAVAGTLSPKDATRLKAHEADILALLAASEGAEIATVVPIQRRDRNAPLPMSSSQTSLWLLTQVEESSVAYNIPIALRLKGLLNTRALTEALALLMVRHESLRTRFVRSKEATYPIVDDPLRGFPLERLDLRRAFEQHKRLADLMLEEVRKPFDLASEPSIRGRLMRLGDEEHVLLITIHHINADGGSLTVLARELGSLYGARLRRARAALEPLPLQYADYAAWERLASTTGTSAKQAFWRAALEGAPVCLELPTDRPRPTQQQYAGAAVTICFDQALTLQLKDLSRQYGMTLFMTLLAGWSLLLARLSGQKDIVIGTPTATRPFPQLEGLIGLFANTIALRMRLGQDVTVEDVLLRAKAVALAAQEHRDLPFEQVVDALKPPRTRAHTPVFQVMLAWQNNESTAFELVGLSVHRLTPPSATARYDLTLELAESGKRIMGTMNYAASLFDEVTVTRHVRYLERLLSQMAANASRRADRIEFLPPGERDRLQLE